jgi:hypothetical protein
VLLNGKNLLGVPYTPGNVGNGAATGVMQPYDPAAVIAPNRLEATVQNAKLVRWDSVMLSLRSYASLFEPHGVFGGIILGDGYWISPNAVQWPQTGGFPTPITYKARVQSIPQWIAPGQANKCLVANPVNFRVMCDPVNYVPVYLWNQGIMMVDGAQTVSFRQARSPIAGGSLGWIITKGSWWKNSTQSWQTIGCANDLLVNTKIMEPWMGVWWTWKAGFEDTSMIVPAFGVP